MQMFATIFSIFLFFGLQPKGERVYTRLDRAYQKDLDRCELLARNYIEKDKNLPEPYYFVSLVNFSKYQNASTNRSKYKYLSTALSFGRKLKRLKSINQLTNKDKWEVLQGNLVSQVPILYDQLQAGGFDYRADKLEAKGYKFAGLILSSKVCPKSLLTEMITPPSESKVDSYDTTIVVVKVANEIKNRLYFGLATGVEIVQSSDVQKEKELVRILNQARKNKGMPELIWDEDLAKAARYHSYDMASQRYVAHQSHDRVNGTLVEVGGTFDRIRKFYNKGFVNSENIAAGSSNSQGTYKQWYNSPGHYRNMFNTASKKVGVGFFYLEGSPYEYYWTFCTATN